ncbi:MAG: 30S ribosomal protein S13 [Candidatus Pacebacteria bacterium]|jgi:small subunit ribosomal protein S13|nr:30S ribosomal protein S13 [Candidatus Paceibacterota bacterium]
MPRIAGINIPESKRVEISLTYVFGIGPFLSKKILNQAGIDKDKKTSELTSEEVQKLKEIIEKEYKVEGDLRKDRMLNVKRLKEISCWRGLRHMKGLPVRGQRTKTNNRTVRGNVKKTVGSGRKGAPAPK